jgi:hypothetical protein
MIQLRPPLRRYVIGGAKWRGPVGYGLAHFLVLGAVDDDLLWVVDMDDDGTTWCVPNRYVRAPWNITIGRMPPKEPK